MIRAPRESRAEAESSIIVSSVTLATWPAENRFITVRITTSRTDTIAANIADSAFDSPYQSSATMMPAPALTTDAPAFVPHTGSRVASGVLILDDDFVQRETLEILETAALTDVGRTMETMTRLRLNGFGLAIDDFGTGFSSFEQLSSIPFTELKIDCSFVTGVADSLRQAAVVNSCIELAHRLKLKVGAEGVEFESNWDFLVAAGATEAQGYYLSKPMPGTVVAAWVDTWSVRNRH